MSCVKQTTKKYTGRKSPPYNANECCGQIKEGNNGMMYESKPHKKEKDKWKWYKVTVKKPAKKPAKKPDKKKSPVKKNQNAKIKKGLQYAEKLVGIKYKASKKPPTKDSAPFWNRNGPVPPMQDIKKGGLACVGVTNLIRRYLDLKIPTETGEWKDFFPGGTSAYFHYFTKKQINYDKTYPKGTLLMEKWNPENQGHVAIVWTESKQGLLYSKILHSRHDGSKSVVIEDLKDYKMNKRFTHICLPKDWMIKN